MSSVIHILLNDDVETAETLLSKGNSPFHEVSILFHGSIRVLNSWSLWNIQQLGKGTVLFLRAVLGKPAF